MTSGPRCIGIIMDGNRRWARERGLPTLEGHRKGAEKVIEMTEWARAAGVQEVIVYAFSTENWNRSPEEVAYLMDLAETYFKKWTQETKKKNGRIRFIGDTSRVSEKLQTIMRELEAETKDGTAGTLTLAFSYGGRSEILHAANTLIKEGKTEVTDEDFSKALWTKGTPDPDLVIRTGGEKRLSNFLPWQTVYSELFFVDTHWPAFEKQDFDSIIEQFNERERRHGK